MFLSGHNGVSDAVSRIWSISSISADISSVCANIFGTLTLGFVCWIPFSFESIAQGFLQLI